MRKFFPKYKTITTLSVLLIISALISPLIKNYYLQNWQSTLNEKISEIENGIQTDFSKRFAFFIQEKNRLKQQIRLNEVNNVLEKFSYVLFNQQDSVVKYNGYYSDKIKLQNKTHSKISIQDDLLFTFITASDELTIDGNKYFFITAELLEKKYNIDNNSFVPVSFSNYLAEKYEVNLSIEYTKDSLINSDGRNHLFHIYDDENKILAAVTFAKPGRDIFINSLDEKISLFQSVLFIILLLTFFYEVIKDIKRKFISETVLVSVYILFIIIFRGALFYLNIPSAFIKGDFVSPAIYSSSFSSGIVSNPLELLLSSITLLILILLLNKRISKFISTSCNKKYIAELSLFLFIVLAFFIVRGYAAVLKSVIFDSSINYFNNDSLILPFVPSTVLLSTLLITLSAFIVLYNFYDGLTQLTAKRFKLSNIQATVIVFIIFQAIGVLFDLIQKEPLIEPPLRIILITGLFLIYFINRKENYKFSTIITYLAILSAAANSILLADFNNSKEEISIKIAAHELNRFDKDFIEANINLFLYDEIYSLIEKSENVNNNYNQFLFYLWANSSIRQNILNSSFYLFDSEKNEVGSFVFNQNDDYTLYFKKLFLQRNFEGPEIFNESVFSNSNSLIGISSFIINEKKYFLGLKINYDLKSLIASNEPEIFWENQKVLMSNQLIDDLLILQSNNGKFISLNKNIKIDDGENKSLRQIKFYNQSDAWNEIEIDGVLYKFYSLQNNVKPNNFISVGLQEKQAPVTLFQFFKVFLIFALFIMLHGIYIVLYKLVMHRKIIVDFRTKVAVSLIIISVAPLILLAFYFRTLTDEKNLEATFYKLNKRAINIEEYLNRKINSSQYDLLLASQSAKQDLGIDFNLYSENYLYYSTRSNIYNSGILSNWINPEIFNRLFIKRQNDILITEQIEKIEYNSIYYKTKFNNEEYIIEVNDLFNSILIPLSISDFDIILFGTYSLAAIFVIILSTILANQISLPIRRLTNAAKSASYGDLNLNIEYKRKDEIGELTDAFNKMLNEIKKMQTDLSTVERETAWKEMAKQVAHEIKNPLTPMKLSMQQLIAAYNDKSPKFDEIFSKVSRTILGQVENLRNIASEFSNFARMPIGELASVNLKEIINEVVNLFTDERIKIEVRSSANSVFVTADANHLKRIFINLIRNSIQANADKLDINIQVSEENISINVTDNGDGIKPELLERIFEKGFTTKNDGMGLGLNLAKRYLKNISGNIKIELSTKEKTIFLITLPVEDKL